MFREGQHLALMYNFLVPTITALLRWNNRFFVRLYAGLCQRAPTLSEGSGCSREDSIGW
mgnify:CR=1 FL=1